MTFSDALISVGEGSRLDTRKISFESFQYYGKYFIFFCNIFLFTIYFFLPYYNILMM